MVDIVCRKASDVEKASCQEWELWESGEADRFEHYYDKDVHFIVQDGKAVIYYQNGQSVAVQPGDHVSIKKGVQGVWEITAPIINRYEYLS